MSRLTGNDAIGLFGAYQAVYSPQELTEEQVWEEVENWVNSLLEEGYDLSDYTWEEMYESYLGEGGAGPRAGTTPSTPSRPYMGSLSAGGGRAAIDKLTAKGVDPRKANVMVVAQGEKNLRAKPVAPAAQVKTPTPTARPAAGAPRPAAGAPRPAATSAAPAASGSSKVTPTKSSASTAQTGDKAKDTATWAKANPKLAAASAERERTRGTSATTNPLMKDMKSKLPAAAPKVDTSTTLGQTAAAALKPSAFSPSSSSSTAAAKTAPTPKPTPRQQRLNMEMEYDAYDVVLEYLFSEGHVDTVEEAHYVMMEMDAEMIQDIVEAKVDERLPEHERSGARLSRYDNPSGALALGGGQQRARREEHKEKRGKKTKG